LKFKLKSFENVSADSLRTRQAALDSHGAHFGNFLLFGI
jgi:hypothetical protein